MSRSIGFVLFTDVGKVGINAITLNPHINRIDTLAYAVQTFVDNCITGITANEERCRYLVESSVGVITAISPHVGYQKAADIAKKALRTGESIRSLILKEGLLTEQELDEILDPIQMTEPGISGKELLLKKS